MMDSQEKALEMGNQEEVAGMEVQEAQAAVEETLPAGQEAQDAGPEAQGEAAQAEGGETAGDQPEAPDYKRHFGSKKEVLERVREILIREMEGVTELSVPLTVECNYGKNWLDAH